MSRPERSAYSPQPGTIPHRVVRYLQDQADLGRLWVPAAELAEHVGQPAVSPYLEAPIRHGALVRRSVKGNLRLREYALGDGKPLPGPEDLEPEEALHSAPVAPPGRGTMFPVPVDSKPAATRPRRALASKGKPRGLWASLYLDGSMLLEVEGQQLTLDAMQVGELARLLRGGAAA